MVLRFSLSSKTNISKFQFDLESGRRRTTLWMCYLQIIIYLFMTVLNDLNQPGHSIADKELIPLELQPTLSMSCRKAREACLIDRGKTLSPDCLNRRINIELFLFLFLLYNNLPVYYSIYLCKF